MNLFNIGVEGQYTIASYCAAAAGRVPRSSRAAQRPHPAARRHRRRRRVGRHRRSAQGDPRRQRGHLDDHAERDRDHAVRLPAQQVRPARGQRRAHHADPGEQPARRLDAVRAGGRRRSGRWHPRRAARRRRSGCVLNKTRFGFDLRATGMSQTAAVASGVNVNRMVVVSDAAVRRRRRADLDAGVLRRRALVSARPSRPDSASPASRSRCSVATSRSASLFGAVLFAFLNEQSNRLQFETDISIDDRADHPGRDRAQRRHRLRGRAPLPHPGSSSSRVAERWPRRRPTSREGVPA